MASWTTTRCRSRAGCTPLDAIRRVLRLPAVRALVSEIAALQAQEAQRRDDDRSAFDRLREIRWPEFAERLAGEPEM